MKNVGYLSGTDSVTLSQLTASGIITIPLSNGWDNHGKYIGMLTLADNIGVVVGYFHKLVAPPEYQQPPTEFLARAKIHDISTVLVCPANVMDKAKTMLPAAGAEVHWVTPDQVHDKVMELLSRKKD